MKTVYEKASSAINDLVQETLLRYHPEVAQLEPVIATLVVRKINDDGETFHALKIHGAEAAACIRKVSGRRRVLVDFDLELNIDGLTWDNIPQESKVALIDHELNHVVAVKDDKGVPKQDDLGHYKFKLRPDDYAINGFFAVAERHGQFALESQSMSRLHARMLAALDTNSQRVAGIVAAAA